MYTLTFIVQKELTM